MLSCHALSAGEEWSLNHHVELTGEFVFLQRSQVRNKAIVLFCPCPTPRILKTENVVRNFDFEPGYRVGLAINPDRERSLEANYLFVSDWEGEKRRKAVGKLEFPFDNPSFTHDFVNADRAEAIYKSRFRSAEANYLKYMTPRKIDFYSFAWILGVRGFYLREKFFLKFTRDMDTSNYNTFTRNLMIGPQGGATLDWNPTINLTWNITVKAGPLADRIRQKVFLGDFNNTVVLRNSKRHKWNLAGFADVAITALYQVTAHFDYHIGYQLYYLTGLALAPEQLSRRTGHDRGRGIHTAGNAIIQGLITGITFSF